MSKSNGKLLKELLVAVATLEERVNNYINKNNEDHNEMKDVLKLIQRVAGDEIKEIEKRLRVLEDRKLQLSTTWKIAILLMGFIPTIFTILRIFGIIK
jgi:hypothetical protein